MNSNIKSILVIIIILLGLFMAIFISVLDFQVRDKFKGALWTIPAKVFSRSLDISEGSHLHKARLIKELEMLGYKETLRVNQAGDFSSSSKGLKIFLRGFSNSEKEQERGLFSVNFGELSKIISIKRSDGILLDFISLEPLPIGGMYPSHMEDRVPLEWSEVPIELIDMLIAIEDNSFFEHHGFSIRAIFRALFKNIASTGIVEGGSTITQQLSKSLFFSPEKTFVRKLMELLVSVILEIHYSKEEILLAYINDVHLAQVGNRSINGFGLAAEHFFGTSLLSLEIDQLSLLVGMLKGPSIYNPRKHTKRATERRDLVLSILGKKQVLTPDEVVFYTEKTIDVISPRYGSHTRYPAFQDLVKLELRDNFSDKDLRINGLKIHTNIDPVIQEITEESLKLTLESLNFKYKQNMKDLQGAAVVINLNSGKVLSLVGGISPNDYGFNRALNASRSIGSLIKPAVYLTALKKYDEYNLNTFLDDSKFTLILPEGGTWQPKNFDSKFHGLIQLHESLWESYNVATARLGMDLGVEEVLNDLKGLGYNEDLIPLPSYLIGSLEMTPLQVAQIYQTIGSEGFLSTLKAVSYVTDSNKTSIWKNPLQLEQRFRSEDIHLLKFPLEQTFTRGTARGLSMQQLNKWNPGGKTGTSNDQRDSWFAGYAGDYLVVIWLGFDDNRKTSLTGRSGALKAWKRIMSKLDPIAERKAIPNKIRYDWVNLEDGLLSGKECNNSVYMPFIKGFEPQVISPKAKNCRILERSYKTDFVEKVKKIVKGINDN